MGFSLVLNLPLGPWCSGSRREIKIAIVSNPELATLLIPSHWPVECGLGVLANHNKDAVALSLYHFSCDLPAASAGLERCIVLIGKILPLLYREGGSVRLLHSSGMAKQCNGPFRVMGQRVPCVYCSLVMGRLKYTRSKKKPC